MSCATSSSTRSATISASATTTWTASSTPTRRTFPPRRHEEHEEEGHGAKRQDDNFVFFVPSWENSSFYSLTSTSTRLRSSCSTSASNHGICRIDTTFRHLG